MGQGDCRPRSDVKGARPSNLLLLVGEMPLSVREGPFRETPFVDAEFGYLCDRFDRVVVVPEVVRGVRKPLPRNVAVDDSWSGVAVRSRRELLAAFRAPVFWREVVEHPEVLLDRTRLVRLLSFVTRAQLGAEHIADVLARHRLEPARTVAYAYTLAVSALSLVEVRRRLSELRIVARAHGVDLYEDRHQPPYLPCRGALLKGLDRIFFISEHGRDYARRWSDFDPSRHVVARLGVPEAQGRSKPSSDSSLRILSCSHMVAVKRLGLLLEAMGELARNHPDHQVCWRHLGDGPERALLEARASEMSIPNLRVQFPGHIPNERLAEEYTAHPVDLFVNVSESEGIPVAIMEALSFGIPVLATDVGGVAEAVQGPGCGLLPANPAPAEIAAAAFPVAWRGRSEEVRSQLREQVRRRFHGPDNFTAFASTLEQLVAA